MTMLRTIPILVLLALAPFARGTVEVIMGPGGTADIALVNGEWEVTITITGEVGSCLVRGSQSDRIRFIDINSGSVSGTVRLEIRGPNAGETIEYVGRIRHMNGSRAVSIDELYISGDLGSDAPGAEPAIKVKFLDFAQIGGDVKNKVILYAGPLVRMEVGGDLLADVEVETRSIDQLLVTGNIGSPSLSPNIWAAEGIKELTANAIWADIDSRYTGGSTGSLRYVQTRTGDFTGSLHAYWIASPDSPSGLDIAGDLNADVTIDHEVREDILVGGVFDSGRLMKINRLLGGRTIDISATQGLLGQIIMNWQNTTGDWDGTVEVGSITLSDAQSQPNQAPHYERLASELGGGGAVGLVSFAIHHESCTPAHDSTTTSYESSAIAQFYGPVIKESSSLMPIRVYKGPYRSTNFGNFTEVTHLFTAAVLSDKKQLEVSLKTGTFSGGRYWLKPITSSPGSETRLLCDDLNIEDDVPVADGDYWFDVLDFAMASLDLSGNGIVDTADTAIWLDLPVDINGDNIANTIDLDIITQSLGRTE